MNFHSVEKCLHFPVKSSSSFTEPSSRCSTFITPVLSVTTSHFALDSRRRLCLPQPITRMCCAGQERAFFCRQSMKRETFILLNAALVHLELTQSRQVHDCNSNPYQFLVEEVISNVSTGERRSYIPKRTVDGL